jgi:hypothetical protein
MMTTLQWLSTEMRTGKVIADLPNLDGDTGPLTLLQTMGRYEQVAVSLPVATQVAVPDWQRATLPGASTLVLLHDDVPVWGAFVNRRNRDHTDEAMLPLTTYEAYFDRRYLGDVSFTQVGQNDIVSSLVSAFAKDGTTPGIPIRIQVTSGGAGKLRDRQYFDKDDKTVYSALQDLSGVIGGPEWTIGWEHQSNPERYTPVLYVGDRIGSPVTPGFGPAATFEMPGPVIAVGYLEDFGAGKGATDVMAYSSGQGGSRPQSPRQVTADPLRPAFEYRWTPSSSITDVDTLISYAAGKLGQISGGSSALSLTADLASAPRLGVDWSLGDDIGYQIGGIDSNGRDTVPGFPGGLSGTARAVGWQINLAETPSITPVLAGSDL